ncbi:unnamed protein product [Trichobilharzia szidati]|nr:unnamed protein product [Trichobilharzia szidati]
MSPVIFLIMVDWILQDSEECEKIDTHRRGKKSLDDLHFACHTRTHTLQDLQAKTNKSTEEIAKIGLQVNIEKTRILGISDKQQQAAITVNGSNSKAVISFTYSRSGGGSFTPATSRRHS